MHQVQLDEISLTQSDSGVVGPTRMRRGVQSEAPFEVREPDLKARIPAQGFYDFAAKVTLLLIANTDFLKLVSKNLLLRYFTTNFRQVAVNFWTYTAQNIELLFFVPFLVVVGTSGRRAGHVSL